MSFIDSIYDELYRVYFLFVCMFDLSCAISIVLIIIISIKIMVLF